MACDISVSGNFLNFQSTLGAGFLSDHIIVNDRSGGVQLPDVKVMGLYFPQFSDQSGGFGPGPDKIIIGGSGNSAPFHDTTIYPAQNGQLLSNFNPVLFPVNNANVFRMVAMSGFSGISVRFYGPTP